MQFFKITNFWVWTPSRLSLQLCFYYFCSHVCLRILSVTAGALFTQDQLLAACSMSMLAGAGPEFPSELRRRRRGRCTGAAVRAKKKEETTLSYSSIYCTGNVRSICNNLFQKPPIRLLALFKHATFFVTGSSYIVERNIHFLEQPVIS